MKFKKVTLLGGGVLGAQIALMNAYTGHDTTIRMRSESSIERTKPRLERYRTLMIQAPEDARKLIGNPMSAYLYPKGLIRNRAKITDEKLTELIANAKKNLTENIHLELDLHKALKGADIVIETMSEDPKAKTEIYKKNQRAAG